MVDKLGGQFVSLSIRQPHIDNRRAELAVGDLDIRLFQGAGRGDTDRPSLFQVGFQRKCNERFVLDDENLKSGQVWLLRVHDISGHGCSLITRSISTPVSL